MFCSIARLRIIAVQIIRVLVYVVYFLLYVQIFFIFLTFTLVLYLCCSLFFGRRWLSDGSVRSDLCLLLLLMLFVLFERWLSGGGRLLSCLCKFFSLILLGFGSFVLGARGHFRFDCLLFLILLVMLLFRILSFIALSSIIVGSLRLLLAFFTRASLSFVNELAALIETCLLVCFILNLLKFFFSEARSVITLVLCRLLSGLGLTLIGLRQLQAVSAPTLHILLRTSRPRQEPLLLLFSLQFLL